MCVPVVIFNSLRNVCTEIHLAVKNKFTNLSEYFNLESEHIKLNYSFGSSFTTNQKEI